MKTYLKFKGMAGIIVLPSVFYLNRNLIYPETCPGSKVWLLIQTFSCTGNVWNQDIGLITCRGMEFSHGSRFKFSRSKGLTWDHFYLILFQTDSVLWSSHSPWLHSHERTEEPSDVANRSYLWYRTVRIWH